MFHDSMYMAHLIRYNKQIVLIFVCTLLVFQANAHVVPHDEALVLSDTMISADTLSTTSVLKIKDTYPDRNLCHTLHNQSRFSTLSNRKYQLQRLRHSFCVATPVALSGLLFYSGDKWVSERVMTGIPYFSTNVDDYLEYLPFASQVLMAVCGLKGSSENLFEVLTADAFALGMMATTTYGLKSIVNRTRPNGGDRGFPSGHAATSFMGATLLAHEYGHISIWIPIAGYGISVATSVLRVLNNEHYMSDVVIGGAIGILTAELAYWAKDAIFKRYNLHHRTRLQLHDNVLRYY